MVASAGQVESEAKRDQPTPPALVTVAFNVERSAYGSAYPLVYCACTKVLIQSN